MGKNVKFLLSVGAPEAVDRFGIPFAEHHLKGQGNVGHLGFQTGSSSCFFDKIFHFDCGKKLENFRPQNAILPDALKMRVKKWFPRFLWLCATRNVNYIFAGIFNVASETRLPCEGSGRC